MKIQRRGFTLVEILIVVVVLGILACIVIPQIQKGVAQNRYSEVCDFIYSDHPVEITYSGEDNKILFGTEGLVTGGKLEASFELNHEYFLKLKDVLQEERDWRFKPYEDSKTSEDIKYLRWYGTRLPEKTNK